MKKTKKHNPFCMFEKVLCRNTGGRPEERLFVGIIVRAAHDAIQPTEDADPIEAESFFHDGRLELVCDVAGLDAETVRRYYADLKNHLMLHTHKMAA